MSATEDERSSAVSGNLYDGPIEGAAVYVDVNRNRRVDDKDHRIDEETDEFGNFEGEIPDRYKGLPLIADNRVADHRGSNVELPAFFVAPAGSAVISPLTHIIELGIVKESVIRQHVLFGQFLPLSDNPHNIGSQSQNRGDYVFYGHIRRFLEELTTSLKEAEARGWPLAQLVEAVKTLLKEYETAIRDAAAEALNLTIQDIGDLTVVENTTRLEGEANLTVAGWRGSVPPVVEYRLAEGVAHDFVTVLPDGRIRLKQAPDHETDQTISFTVDVRYFREGQGDDVGWHCRRDITIDVTDIIDEALSLQRNAAFQSGDGVTANDGSVTVTENTPASRVLYKVAMPDPDVAGNHIYFYLSGDDAGRFIINGLGELRLKDPADHEAKSSYSVTIHARELAAPPTAHNQAIHPPKPTAVTDASHHVTITVTDVNERPTVSIGGAQTLTLNEGSSDVADTGYTVSVTDPDAGDAVSVRVDDDRFEIVDGKLVVKAGQRFDYETEPIIDLTIAGAHRQGLEDKQTVTINVTDVDEAPSLSVDVQVPAETTLFIRGTPFVPGFRLEPLTISNRYRGGNDERGQERLGHVDVVSRNVGNHLILKMRFGDGAEQVVARLVRDDAQSSFRLDTSDGHPAFFTKFAGVFGHVQITDLTALPETEDGHSHTRVSWKYTTFFERGSGAPANRLKTGESAREAISFVVEGDAVEGEGDVREDAAVSFTIRGGADRPVLLLGTRPDSGAPSDSVEEDPSAPVEEFPLAPRGGADVRTWRWWDMANIAEYSRFTMSRTNTVDADNGLVWRFVPIDEDGDYFIGSGNGDGGAGRDYGDVSAFIDRYVRFEVQGLHQKKLIKTHPHLEIVQAVDSTGAPRFITMPGGKDRMPVLELRLKAGIDAPSTIHATLVVLGTGQDMGLNRVDVRFQITVTDANDTPPVFTSDDTADPVPEDVALGINAGTRGDGRVIYQAEATPDVAGDKVIYSLKPDAGDDSAMFGFDEKSGEVWFKDAPDHETRESYSFTVIASAGGQHAKQSVTINVTNVNEKPTVTLDGSQTLTLHEGSSIAGDTGYTVGATDPDSGDAVTFHVRDDKRFEVKGGKLRVKDGQSFDYENEPIIDLIIIGTDRGGLTHTQTVTITVTNVNDMPLTWKGFADVPVSEGMRDTGLVVTTARKHDAAGQEVTHEIVDAAMRDIFEISPDGRLMFRDKPDYDDDGPNSYDVVIRATSEPVRNGGGTPQTAEWTVRVEVTNLLDEVLTINAITDLVVRENSTSLTGTARLGVTSRERGAYEVEYRLAGGAAHDFVTVLPNGRIHLKQAPDHETMPSLSFAVEMRYVREGQEADVGWQGRRDITINVTDINDMPTIIGGGATKRILVPENTASAIYRPDLISDDAVTTTLWELSGEDAGRFVVDQRTGIIRFKRVPDHEVPHDADRDNRYKVKLSVKTFDEFKNERSATQDLEINVGDVSVVMGGGSGRHLTVKENYAGTFTTIKFFVDESDFGRLTFTLAGKIKDLFNIEHHYNPETYRSGLVNLSFKRPPNFETRHLEFGDNLKAADVVGALYTVDVVVTAIWADGSRKSATKSIWISLQDEPEAPEVSLERDPGFYILTTERSQLRDTGYRFSATDEDGDSVTFSLSRNPRFRIGDNNDIWIKKGQVFGPNEGDGVTLYLKAIDSSLARKTTTLPFSIPVKPRLDNIDDMFRIVGDAQLDVDENLPVETPAYRPTVAWGEGYESSMPVVWSLHGDDRALLRIDPATGVVRFVNSPDYESNRTVYHFTVQAAAVGGQLVNQKVVTINIQDVDEAPSEMLIIDVHDDEIFTLEELDVPANRKLAKIRFVDVDSQAGNDVDVTGIKFVAVGSQAENAVEIDVASQDLFEIRQATRADGTIKTGTYRLWLKDGVTLEEGAYTITITAVIDMVRREDMRETFIFTVTASGERDIAMFNRGGTSQQPPVKQSTEVVNVAEPLDDEPLPLPADNGLSVDVM